MSIFDVTGKIIVKENRVLGDENEISLSNNLLNGTYLVKVKMEDGTCDVRRLVISK